MASTPSDNQDDAIKDSNAVTGSPGGPAGAPAQGGSPGWTPPAATGAGQPTAPGADPGGQAAGYPAQGTPTGYPAPGTPTGYPPQGAPAGYPAPGAPTGYPAPGTPTGYPAPGTPTGYPPQGAPAGYPAQGWSPPAYASAPAGPKPGFGLRLTAMLLAIVGWLGILVACVLPFVYFPGSSPGGQSAPSVLFPGGPGVLRWFAAEPVVVAFVALAAGIVLLASSSQGVRWAMSGMLLAFGIQTALLFAGYLFATAEGSGAHHGPGGPAGIVAGLLLLAAGILGLIGTAAGQRAAAGYGGATAPGGTAPA